MLGTIALAPLAALGVATLFGVWDPPEPIPEELAQRAFAREAAASRAIGLALHDEHDEALHGGGTERTIPLALEADECVGVTAAAWGFFSVRRVSIVGSTGRELAVGEQQFAIAKTVQWCAVEAESLTAKIELANADTVLGRDAYAGGHARWEIDRGRPAGTFAVLSRGRPTVAGARLVPRSTLIARADAMVQDRTALGPAIDIAAHRARLVPESAQGYSRMHTLADNGRGDPVTPRWDPLPVDVPPAWRPLASFGQPSVPRAVSGGQQTAAQGAHPAIVFRDGSPYRLLAVVDPRVVGGGARCVHVQLVRLLWGYRTEAGRLDRRGVQSERNVMLDWACDAGAVEYVAPADDHETYLLRFFSG